MTAASIEVRRFAIKFEPPTLVVEYQKHLKTYVKKIKLNTKGGSSSLEGRVKALTDLIIENNIDVVGPEIVSREQIEDLVQMIFQKKILRPADTDTATDQISNKQLDPFGDLNKASDDVVERAKQTMSVDFEAKRLKPGDEGYEYDKQTDFEPPSGVSEWDEDEED
jgi:centrosomal protein CEP19